MINAKRTELTPKLSIDMASLLRKLFLEAYSHQFLTQNLREGFWQPRNILREGNKHEK
jgi:hypothetical protein